MAIFYNSVITYDNASTAYNGTATAYSYSGGITINIVLNHNIFDGTNSSYTYLGRLTMDILSSSPYVRGFLRVPSTSGITLRVVPNSSMLIRQYYKFSDPVRIGGCVFCGTYLYNE